MQACMIDLLLHAYLTEHSQSIDVSRFSLPKIDHQQNAILTLETIYLGIQQSLSSNKNLNTTSSQHNAEEDETVVEQENTESSQISITVCDEAKTVKRQFSCNRSLLIREMRYFADYLKDEPDQAEEVDISVHCDLDIFQWLMSFVNRRQSSKAPELEPRIAVSILISSDFLKMDKLVVQSLDYIHEHMNEIIATNCTVSCIPDTLFRQLAKHYLHNPYEIEQIHDRRNKMRGKLFEYNLEQLLHETKILRCQHCLTVTTMEQMEHLSCSIDRSILMSNGKLSFQHRIDPKFDVNQWTKDIYTRAENSWRNTYWIVWLHIHGDQCVRCNTYFRFIDYSTCPFHPRPSVTDNKHDCCSHLVSTFDVLQLNLRDNGCQQREHLCQTQNHFSQIYENLDKTELTKQHSILRQAAVKTTPTEEMIRKIMEQSIYGSNNPEPGKTPMRAQWTPLLDTYPCGAEVKYLWDATKSTRWNQDTQREDEHRRFDEMLRYIQSVQQNNKTSSHQRTLKEPTSSSALVSPGGIYCRIENDWRTRQHSSINSNTNTTNKTRQRLTLK